jgi:transposase InsO family protein
MRISSKIEDLIVTLRKKSGFGPKDISVLINESMKRQKKRFHLWPSTAYNVLVRTGEIERERRIQKNYRSFEWGHPNRLIQTDLTKFNGIPILTMEDDHSRKGWALALRNQKDKSVIRGMKKLIPQKYDNLLTDNGSQFSRRNSEMRKYCDEFLNEKHIWTSVHHPQTMGKLSAFQKAMKRFLKYHLHDSRDVKEINHWISIFVGWYNNAKYHSSISCFPEERYSGKRADDWYESIVKDLKLDELLTV